MRISEHAAGEAPAIGRPRLPDARTRANAGALGVLWALVRIAWPLRRLVASDAVARCAVALLLAYSIEARGVSPVLYSFVATELLGAAVQAWALPRLREPIR